MALTGAELERLDESGRNYAKTAWLSGGLSLRTVAHEPPRAAFVRIAKGRADDEAAWLQFRHGYRCELHNLNLQHEMAQKRATAPNAQTVGV